MTTTLSFLSDSEAKVDLLNAEAIASTIVKVIRERPATPITVGVHGDWGAGKSSVLEMIEAGLAKEKGVLCLKFNGWRFQGFEDAKIALIEGIVTDLLEKRPLLKKADAAVKDVLKRIDWLKLAKKAGGLAFTAYTGIPTAGQLQMAMGALEAFASDPKQAFSKENVQAAIGAMKDSVTLKPAEDSKHIPDEVREFLKAFDKLLADAGIDQLVVLIDDLDRCLPDTAIETLEAIRLFVFTSKTAFVIAADEGMIEYAVRKHFPDLPDSSAPQTYARNYLEKLIQVPFRIPTLGETETRIYVTLLLVGAALGDNDADFNKLIAAARERLKRPWTKSVIDGDVIKTALGSKAALAQEAKALSDQIGPILASGARGNPRQIKRFLNTLLLRQRAAAARGFEADVKLPVLAKLLLAERFLPQLYEHIASIAAISTDGKCAELATLEKAAKAPAAEAGAETQKSGVAKVAPPGDGVKKSDAGATSEWLAHPGVAGWAKIDLPLAEVDLRPYLFVAKERRDFFAGASILGHLAPLAEKLFGPKMAVQGLDADIRRLSATEAPQVFEVVRARIMAAGTFDVQPGGVDGLIVLVKAHPSLQSNLMEFLESLPRAKVGPWVLRGWEGVFTDGQIERYARALQGWATASDNPTLKAAAASVLAVRSGKSGR